MIPTVTATEQKQKKNVQRIFGESRLAKSSIVGKQRSREVIFGTGGHYSVSAVTSVLKYVQITSGFRNADETLATTSFCN